MSLEGRPERECRSAQHEGSPVTGLLVLAIAGACAFAAVPGFAADNPQQERMKECNAKAGDRKGDERKAFMSACLSAKTAAPATNTQQEKMKTCNQKAGDMKGDERKKFMSECLKG
jgi:hypothetical protein